MSAATAAAPVAAAVTAAHCWIRLLPGPVPSGGYLVVRNAGKAAVALKGVTSPEYGMAMLHKSSETGGVSTMSPVSEIPVPAGGEVAFQPGGYHVMLEKPRAGIKVGDTVALDFALSNGAHVPVSCAVRPATAMSDSGG